MLQLPLRLLDNAFGLFGWRGRGSDGIASSAIYREAFESDWISELGNRFICLQERCTNSLLFFIATN